MLFRPTDRPDSDPRSTASVTPPRRFGVAMRLLCFLAGVDPVRLAACPGDDRQAAIRIGLAMLLSFCFVTLALSAAMAIAFGQDDGVAPWMVLAAMLPAAGYVLLDNAIVQSDWYQSGLRAARARGLHAEGPTAGGRLRGVGLLALRLGMSLPLAFCAASFLELLIYAKDIERQRLANHRAANVEVFAAATRQVDAGIARLAAELAGLERAEAAALTRHEEAAGALQAAIRQQAAARETRLAALLAARDARLEEATRRRNDAIAEEHGRREAAHHSGVPGRRAQYQAAIAFAEQAEGRAAAIQAEIDRLRAAEGAAPRDLSAAAAASSAYLDSTAALRRTARVEWEGSLARRTAAIRAVAEADPRFVPLSDGLIERQAVLLRVLIDQGALPIAISLMLVLMLVEMAGLLAKLLHSRASLYAARSATETEAGIAAVIAEAELDITQSAKTRLDAADARCAREAEHERAADRRRAARRAREEIDRALG